MAKEPIATGHLATMVQLAMGQLTMGQLTMGQLAMVMGCPAMVTQTMAPQRAMEPPIVSLDQSTTAHF